MPVDLTPGDRANVAHLQIDFGELNLVTHEWVRELTDAAHSVPGDVAVVTVGAPPTPGGNVRGLTAGLDLAAAKEFSAHDGWDLLEGLYEAIGTVRDLDAVTICRCGDYALGAGFELAIACDFRVATPDAALGLPEVNVGLPTVIMGGLLIRHVGEARAKELIYTGEPISGEEAHSMDLVSRVAPAAEYDDTVAELVGEFAAKSPEVLAWQSYVFRHWRSVGLEAGMKHSIGVGSRCFDTADQREAMQAFLENREPDYAG